MAKNKGSKRGRPPKDLAGDVQTRILDAAQQLFLERGFHSTSIDEIAETAPASKPTIYAHFPGKEALFTAVVGRTINGLTNFEGFTPQGRTIQDKLANLGTRDRGEIYRGYARPNPCHDRRGPTLSGIEPKCARRRARPSGRCRVTALKFGGTETRPLTKEDHSAVSENSLRRRCSWISFCFRCL